MIAVRRPPREPSAIRALAHDKHGRPVPWFAHVDEHGNPDHRVIRRNGIVEAIQRKICWTCGTLLGRESAFVIGPMCAINRITSEPPSHRECARYSADTCPFLSTPHMRRRSSNLPDTHQSPAGVAIMRNPGVACVWFARGFKPVTAPNGVLFEIGEPSRVYWRARGREATRAEIMESIDSGYPALVEAARADPDPESALAELEQQREAALRLVPTA